MQTTAAARRGITWTLVGLPPVLFLALFFAWPIVALAARGLGGEGGGIDLGGLAAVLAEHRTWQVARQTVLQATLGTALAVVLGVPAAFVLFKLRFRGQAVMRALIAIPFVLPTVVVAVAFTAVLREGGPLGFLGLEQSLAAIVLALAFFNVTVVARTVGGFWAGLDPRPAQAAATLGASPARVFATVTLPSLAPAIASAAALVFLFCATSFGVVLVLGGRAYANLETEIYRSTVLFFDLRTAAVLALLQLVLVVLVLAASALLRRRSERALPTAAPPIVLARRHLPVLGVVLATMGLLHALPLGALVARSFTSSEGSPTLEHFRALFAPPAGSGLNVSVVEAAGLSLRSALIASALAMTLGVALSFVLSRRPRSRAGRRTIGALDGAAMLPVGVSAVTVGFGLLLTMRSPLGLPFDLRTSEVLIPIAQAIVALPLVIRSVLPAWRAIDARQRDAAATLGASPWRVFATVDLPLVARPLGLALGFAFAVSLGEFGATAFLVRPEAQTLPVVIAHLVGRQGSGNYEMGLAAAVVLGALTAAVMLVAERLRGPGGKGEF